MIYSLFLTEYLTGFNFKIIFNFFLSPFFFIKKDNLFILVRHQNPDYLINFINTKIIEYRE